MPSVNPLGELIFLAAALASYVGINVAALCAAIEFGIQPLLYVNEAGQALYCPYPLSISIPAMMFGHLTLFGLAEAVFTGAIFSYLAKTAPSLLAKAEEVQQSASRAAYGLVAALIVLTPLGLLAEGTAWGEWGTEEMAELTEDGAPLGYTPSGMEDGFSFESMFPDYVVSGLPEVAGYILSALIGTALIVLLFRIGSSLVKSSPDYDAHRQGA